MFVVDTIREKIVVWIDLLLASVLSVLLHRSKWGEEILHSVYMRRFVSQLLLLFDALFWVEGVASRCMICVSLWLIELGNKI